MKNKSKYPSTNGNKRHKNGIKQRNDYKGSRNGSPEMVMVGLKSSSNGYQNGTFA